MCNPAEFFVDTMSKHTILSEDNKYEKKWFPSLLIDEIKDEKQIEELYEPPDDEIVLLVDKSKLLNV